MPSSNKTSNLNLNSWIATDKPKREDFVNDNNIIDNIVGSHILNTVMHLSSEDRENFSNPFYIDLLSGDGNASCTFTLDIEPKLVFVYLRNKPLISYDYTHSCTVCNCGIAVPNLGSTQGVTLSTNVLTLSQSQSYPSSGGTYINLNYNNGQYVCIALK